MRALLAERFVRSFTAAPPEVQRAFGKQLAHLLRDLRHRSLDAKKYDERRDIWQARVNGGFPQRRSAPFDLGGGGRAGMSGKRITRVVVGRDGKPRRQLPSGRLVSLKGKTDWKQLAAMKETEVESRARADRDARPVGRARLKEFERATLTPAEVRAIRHRRGLSQPAFAARYGLNLRTLQDWEQGRAQPDGPTRAYLLVIDREPRAVERALAAGG